jgi:hypothetical protein
MLPTENKADYLYNVGVDAKLKIENKLDRIAPNTQKLHEFNEKITSAVYEVK